MNKKLVSGFTMVELMVAVGIIGILAALGTAVFSRSLRGSSAVETRRSLDERARVISNGLSRFFREGEMVSLDGQTRTNCLSGGSINGDSAVINALDSLSTTVSVNAGGIISSVSAQTVEINPEGVTVDHQSGLGYYFSWYCSSGVPDRLVMQFKATVTGVDNETNISGDYTVDITMRNSGQ